LSFFNCDDLGTPFVLGKTLNNFPQHLFVGICITQGLKVVGYVDETSEHLLDGLNLMHLEQFVLMDEHVDLCLFDLARSLISYNQLVPYLFS